MSALVLDFDDLVKQFAGNESFARELLSDCGADLPARIARIRAAVADGDTASIAEQAHGLKGMCANLRLPALRIASAELESAASTGLALNVALAVERLAVEADRFLQSMS